MKQYILEENITVFCITAASFPAGVQEAHRKLHNIVPLSPLRKYFGISYPVGKGVIEYKAAATELTGEELSKHLPDQFTIMSGNYIYIDIPDFMKHIPAIGEAFKKLISDERIDPTGVCIEWYLNENNCRCMVKTKSK
jgi:hypothetical protein